MTDPERAVEGVQIIQAAMRAEAAGDPKGASDMEDVRAILRRLRQEQSEESE